jgi:hypothetical protein
MPVIRKRRDPFAGEIMRNVPAIRDYVALLENDPDLSLQTVYKRIARGTIPVRRDGRFITGSKTVIREALMQPDPFSGSTSPLSEAPALAAAGADHEEQND